MPDPRILGSGMVVLVMKEMRGLTRAVRVEQAGLFYRAIDMHMRLFHWDRALELAVHHKTHVDTVLAMRERYLTGMGREETAPRFLQYREGVVIEWDKIQVHCTRLSSICRGGTWRAARPVRC